MAVSSVKIGKPICEALGLDANEVSELVITLKPRDLATIEVTMVPDLEQFKKITAILKRYHLVDMTPPAEE